MEDIEKKVIDWATVRGIYSSTLKDQYIKMMSEAGELADAIFGNDREGLIDAIGDVMVLLTNMAHMIDVDLRTCYAHAWSEIKDRKGKMVNGTFVKEVK